MVRYGNLMAEKMVYLYEQMFYLLCSDENLAILEEWGLKVSLSSSEFRWVDFP